jgi:ABC-2 type transport system ATP-binding protein
MQTAPALTVRGLSRRYGGFEALRDLLLEIAPGECVAIVGYNGSGKTTAVRTIAGLLEPSAGSVEVACASVHQEPDGIEARAAMAIVPDTPALYPDLTVREHLELVAVAHGVADDGVDVRIDRLLTRLGLEGKRDARPGALSRGMRQKVGLGCALIRPHRLLVLDEPVVGLDPASQQTLRELLLEAKAAGVAVMMTTHQLEFARGIADRAVVLADGVVVAEGPYDEVVDGGWIDGLRPP